MTGINPNNGATGVAQDEEITVTFSEAMDPASAAGNITLSSGTITNLAWLDTRTLSIDHAPWAEGVNVAVTVGTGLADAGGNGLAASYGFSFYVFTSTLTVLETTPANGATDVSRSSNVRILFSSEVDLGSVTANTTVTSGVTKVAHPYTVSSEHSTVTLNITGDLPASTLVTVTIGAGVSGSGGTGGPTLGTPYVFSFTTGTTVDTTPPTVVSVFPANGATAAANVGIFRVTFSEPMDPDSFEPSAWNIEFALLLMATDPTPIWTEDFTVATVSLPSPLPAGLPMELTFSGLTDQNGVTQPTPWTWEAEIAGTPDYYPVVNGTVVALWTHEEGGVSGSTEPVWAGDYWQYLKVLTQANGTFRLAEYESDAVTPTGDYEIMRKTSSQMQWAGFKDSDQASEILFSTPLNTLPLPVATGTWNSSTTVTIPGDGTFSATMTGNVTGKVDLPIEGGGGMGLFYKDAYRVVRRLEVTSGGSLAFVNSDTTYYSATLGEVQRAQYDDEPQNNAWRYEQTWRSFDVLK